MKNILALMVLMLGMEAAVAQDYVFRVMLNKGANQYGDGQAWNDLTSGTKLQAGDQIKVAADGYVGLVHSSGATLELKDQGEHAVKDLDATLADSETSLMQKYTAYIMENISDEGHHRLAATGAVERGLFDIDVYLQNYADYFSDTLTFDWENKAGAGGYVVRLNDKFDELILEKETKASQLTVDFSSPKLKYQDLVIVYITVKGDENPKPVGYGIKPLQRDDYARVKEEFDQLHSQVDAQSAMGNLVLATFFEENNLLPDAVTYYLNAINLSSGVDEYQKLYSDFLLRNGLKKAKTN